MSTRRNLTYIATAAVMTLAVPLGWNALSSAQSTSAASTPLTDPTTQDNIDELTRTLPGVRAHSRSATTSMSNPTSAPTSSTTPPSPSSASATTQPVSSTSSTTAPVGDSMSATTREGQQRLTWAGVYSGPITGRMDRATTSAIQHFQAKYLIRTTGNLGPQTMAKLRAVTAHGSAIDPRCLTSGRVLCADQTQRILRVYVDGVLQSSTDARFGKPGTETVDGAWPITWKSRHHRSTIFNNAPMPFAMFFYLGEAVHYSADMDAYGFGGAGGSAGCINIGDRAYAEQLFDSTPVHTVVVVYHSA